MTEKTRYHDVDWLRVLGMLMLFVFSLLLLPLFRSINRSPGFTAKLAGLIGKRFGPYLFIVPLCLIELLVSLSPGTIGRRDFGGWSPLTYLVVFLIGYLIATDERYRPAIQRVRYISLAASLLTVVAAYILLAEMDVGGTNPVYLLVRATNAWCWLLTFMGFAGRHLNVSNRFLRYANEAVLPFYILHQTVIDVIGYFIREWNWAVFPKFLFLASTSCLLIIGLYEFVVKRVRVLRFLFGMKA